MKNNVDKAAINQNEEMEVFANSYFDYVKSRKKENSNEELQKIYNKSLELLSKYNSTGQIEGMKKLIFILESVEKEFTLIDKGYTTYIEKDDIQEYIDTVKGKVVKIIEMERYEREIPDDIVEKVLDVKDIFDDFYIVFTDYTGEAERKVAKERKDKDPILFGVFYDDKTNDLLNRFYFIGDWEDEYCDLTLDKMVHEMSVNNNKDIKKDLLTDKEINEIKRKLMEDDLSKRNIMIKKPSLLRRIINFFK